MKAEGEAWGMTCTNDRQTWSVPSVHPHNPLFIGTCKDQWHFKGGLQILENEFYQATY